MPRYEVTKTQVVYVEAPSAAVARQLGEMAMTNPKSAASSGHVVNINPPTTRVDKVEED